MTNLRSTFEARRRSTNRSVWLWIAAIGLLSTGAILLLVHALGTTRAAAAEISKVSLSVRPATDGLLLTWDPRARSITSADRVTLTIADGGRTEDVDLDLAYVRTGGVKYSPVSSDVSFWLRASNQAERTMATASVRVLSFQPKPVTPGPLADPIQAAVEADMITTQSAPSVEPEPVKDSAPEAKTPSGAAIFRPVAQMTVAPDTVAEPDQER